MKNRIAILFLSMWAVIICQAAVITATVTSKTAAEVTGDETGEVEATYSTTGTSKDRLTSGTTATMTLTKLPDGTIEYVVLYMHSNTNAGAGSMSLKLNGVSIATVSDKKFSDWPGIVAFSTEHKQVGFSGEWSMSEGSTLTLQIKASENSLYFSKMEVAYTKGDPKPHTVTLNWNTADGDKQTTITETSLGSGIVLPECALSSFSLEGENWAFAGWASECVLARMKAAPEMLYAGDTYYPTHNTPLYAVYKTVPEEVAIMQDTLFQSGVYALVMQGAEDLYFIASGAVQDKKIKATLCEVEMQADGRYRLLQDYVPANARYEVIFDEQTAQITNIATESTIGHTKTDLTTNSEVWNWQKGKNHSVAIYFSPVVNNGQLSGKLLMPFRQSLQEAFTFQAFSMTVAEENEYALLFDVTDVPTASETDWTTHPFGYDAIKAITVEHSANKIIRNGIILIENNGSLYDLVGRKIENRKE